MNIFLRREQSKNFLKILIDWNKFVISKNFFNLVSRHNVFFFHDDFFANYIINFEIYLQYSFRKMRMMLSSLHYS